MPRAPDALFWQRFATGIELQKRPTHTNDISYSLGQITEIAVRALSPGINDRSKNSSELCPVSDVLLEYHDASSAAKPLSFLPSGS